MGLEKIQSVEDLQKSGSVSDLVEQIKTLISPLSVEADTYDELFKIVRCLQKNWLPLVAKGPFISQQAEFVFYLTKLEGKQRNEAIGITDELYEDKAKAEKWYKQLRSLVHPDKGGDKTAFDVLTKLYDVLVDAEEGDNV